LSFNIVSQIHTQVYLREVILTKYATCIGSEIGKRGRWWRSSTLRISAYCSIRCIQHWLQLKTH